jgi:hypothetical protein
LLTAELLDAAGYSCTLIDSVGLAGGQSNHSHGYLHQGYIYVNRTGAFVAPLLDGHGRWERRMAEANITPVTEVSTIAFESHADAQFARRTWRDWGLEVQPTPTPSVVDSRLISASFTTAEPAYDFTPMWSHLADRLRPVPMLPAELRRLHVERQAIEYAEVTSGPHRLHLRARAYVIAAGWNNEQIMRQTVSYRGRAISRLSYMLIVAGTSLPRLSLVLPGHERYGLFAVSRPMESGNAWLVSNYLSVAYPSHRELGIRLWLASMVRGLRSLAPVLADPALLWGVYPAPKGELRDVPGEMKSYSCEDYGLENALALAPTKLTLAPLLADEAAERVIGIIGAPGSADHMDALSPYAAGLDLAAERWQREPLVPLEELLARHGCAAELASTA